MLSWLILCYGCVAAVLNFLSPALRRVTLADIGAGELDLVPQEDVRSCIVCNGSSLEVCPTCLGADEHGVMRTLSFSGNACVFCKCWWILKLRGMVGWKDRWGTCVQSVDVENHRSL